MNEENDDIIMPRHQINNQAQAPAQQNNQPADANAGVQAEAQPNVVAAQAQPEGAEAAQA